MCQAHISACSKLVPKLLAKTKSIMNEDYSPTSWDQLPGESDEDYADRVQDPEDWLESFDD